MALDNENNWQSVYNQFHSVTGEISIGKILIPGTFTKHTIRIYSTSLAAKPHWWLAGTLCQLLGSNSSTQPDFEGSRRRVPLNRITLIQLPPLTTIYRLKFEVPRWHKEIALVIEVYTGE
jgi:hypothetical protein